LQKKNSQDWAKYLYWRGRTERSLDLLEEAQQSFKTVIQLSPEITTELYIIPHALTELAEMAFEKGDIDNAKNLLLEAKNNYTNYDFDKPLERRIAKSLDLI